MIDIPSGATKLPPVMNVDQIMKTNPLSRISRLGRAAT
jgi:hypothetical protein